MLHASSSVDSMADYYGLTSAVSHGRSRSKTNPDLVSIEGRRSTEPTRSGADPQPLRSWWKSGTDGISTRMIH
ncbi:hypothetical protein PO909_015840 [Leuciscus waleckii]